MDFDINWTLEDARMVTKDEYNAVLHDPNDKSKIRDLEIKGKMYTDSLRTINNYCRPELAQYREAIIHHSSSQEELLDTLYQRYYENYSKTIICEAFSSIKNFFKFVFN